MKIVTYESRDPETPKARRWLAQIEQIKDRFYVTFHGADENEARGKAQKMWDAIGISKRGEPKSEPESLADEAEDDDILGDLL